MNWAGLPAFVPDWNLPVGVRALQTECGVGAAPDGGFNYGGFNLGDHVGDDAQQVNRHRECLARATGAAPFWLRQVHGTEVCELTPAKVAPVEADAVMTEQRALACTIMTADCLPVLVADRQARVVGAAHAGWRGLAQGVIQALLAALTAVPGVNCRDLTVWLGPAIGPTAFEVGDEVRAAFVALNPTHERWFNPLGDRPGKYLANLPELARDILHQVGVEDVTLSGLCTVSLQTRFYSYRRDGVTGRMASLIWLD